MDRNRAIASLLSIAALIALGAVIFGLAGINPSTTKSTQNDSQTQELSYEERIRLNNSLNSFTKRLLDDNSAADLKYEEVPNSMDPASPFEQITFTDSLGRKITILLSSNNITQWIKLDGESNVMRNNPDVPKDWKTFTSPELGLSFMYPPSYEDAGAAINRGDTGKIFIGLISKSKCVDPPCQRVGIQFGGASEDYGAPREAIGIEGQGFIKRDDKYYTIGLGGREEEITYQVKEIQAVNTTGIILSGNDEPSPGAMTPNKRLAIFNLNSSQFNAVSFLAYLSDEITEQEFESILRTVEIE